MSTLHNHHHHPHPHHQVNSGSAPNGVGGSIPLPVSLGGPHPFPVHSLSYMPRKSLDFLTRLPSLPSSPMVHPGHLPVSMASLHGLTGLSPAYLSPAMAGSHFFGSALHGYRNPLVPSVYSPPNPTAAAAHSFQALLATLSNQRPKLSSDLCSPNDYQSLLCRLSTLHQPSSPSGLTSLTSPSSLHPGAVSHQQVK